MIGGRRRRRKRIRIFFYILLLQYIFIVTKRTIYIIYIYYDSVRGENEEHYHIIIIQTAAGTTRIILYSTARVNLSRSVTILRRTSCRAGARDTYTRNITKRMFRHSAWKRFARHECYITIIATRVHWTRSKNSRTKKK